MVIAHPFAMCEHQASCTTRVCNAMQARIHFLRVRPRYTLISLVLQYLGALVSPGIPWSLQACGYVQPVAKTCVAAARTLIRFESTALVTGFMAAAATRPGVLSCSMVTNGHLGNGNVTHRQHTWTKDAQHHHFCSTFLFGKPGFLAIASLITTLYPPIQYS